MKLRINMKKNSEGILRYFFIISVWFLTRTVGY